METATKKQLKQIDTLMDKIIKSGEWNSSYTCPFCKNEVPIVFGKVWSEKEKTFMFGFIDAYHCTFCKRELDRETLIELLREKDIHNICIEDLSNDKLLSLWNEIEKLDTGIATIKSVQFNEVTEDE